KLILILITASLVACGCCSGSSSQPAPQPAFSPEVTNLSSMKLVDASGASLANASVTITPVTAGAQMAAPAMVMTSAADSQNLTTDQHGNLTLRSEEHTSELQSRENLVCRLLLEKKKQQK